MWRDLPKPEPFLMVAAPEIHWYLIWDSVPITARNMPTQQAAQQLEFLRDRIQNIGTAIFFNLSDSLLKLPTAIISNLNVDTQGNVWFYTRKPHSHVQSLETNFPVRLDFFKKGADYFLQVSGKAYVVTDGEVCNTVAATLGEPEVADVVLVRVKMLKVEYFETSTKPTTSWWQNTVQTVSGWFRNNSTPFYPAS